MTPASFLGALRLPGHACVPSTPAMSPRFLGSFSRPASLVCHAAAAATSSIRLFSSNPVLHAVKQAKGTNSAGFRTVNNRGPGKKPASARTAKKRGPVTRDSKFKILDKALYKLKFAPPPLRMGRNRYLRHWTIHRAWLLFRRQKREQRERELMQQYQSMQNACEELRKTAGPGMRDLGYLFRVAMEKKGVWGHDGIPIEYARPQTETPAREAWNHGWKR